MALKITNPTEQVAVLNRWADGIESQIRAARKSIGHINTQISPFAAGSTLFSFGNLSDGTNISAAMVVGSGASLIYSGVGIVNANEIGGIDVAGNTPANPGQILISQSGNLTALWKNPPILFADQFPGASASARIIAAIAVLPSTGGTIDARGDRGAQSWVTNPLAGVVKPVVLLLGASTITITAGVTITLPNNSHIVGSGINVTIFKFANTGAVHGFGIAATNSGMSDFTVDMQSTGTGSGIHITAGGADYDFERLEVKNGGSHGMFFDPGAAGISRYYCEELLLHNNAGNGLYMSATTTLVSCSVGVINRTECNDNGGDGIKLQSLDTSTPIGPLLFNMARCETNGGHGVNLVKGQLVSFNQIEAESNGGWGIAIDSSSSAINIFAYDGNGGASGSIQTNVGINVFILGGPVFAGLRGTQAILQPALDADIPFIVRGHSGTQSGDLTQWQDSATNVQGKVTATGILDWSGNNTHFAAVGSGVSSFGVTTNIQVVTLGDAWIGQTIKWGTAGQTGDFLQLQNNAGTPLFTVDKSGTLTVGSMSAARITSGQLALARGGTNADLSATGGTAQLLRQSSAGAAITVSTLAASELSNGVTGSGAVVLASAPTLTGQVLVNDPSGAGVPGIKVSKTAGDFSAKIQLDATFLTGGIQWGIESTGGGSGDGQGNFVLSRIGTDTPFNLSGTGLSLLGSLTLKGATPTTAAGQLGIGVTTGFGTGTAGTAVTTTTLGGGSGPTTAETVVKYLEIDLAGTKYWVPLMS